MSVQNSTAAQEKKSGNSTPMDLGTLPIGRLLVQYSIPAIIAFVVTSAYNIIDSIFIGRGVGAMAIAGLAITFPLMNLVVGFCTLIATGGSAIASIFLGQKNINRATDVVNNVLTLCIIHSVVFGGLALIFLDPILTLFGATPQTLPYAREFMEVILYGTPLAYLFIGLNNVMRATGYPRKAMISALLSVAVNLITAPVFIFLLGWGIKGAALGTLCGQGAGLVWVMHHFLSKDSFVRLQRERRWLVWNMIQRIYAIGLAPFLMNCCACVVVVFLNKALLSCTEVDGNLAVGAYGIINRAAMFFVMVVAGLAQGMQPILGFNYGAGKWDRVKKTFRIGIFFGAAITTVGFIIAQIFPTQVSGMFTTDKEMISIAKEGFHICFLFFPVIGAQIIIQNYFQSIGHPVWSIFLSLTRQLIFLLPLLWVLPGLFGVDGVWWSMALSDITAFLLALVVAIVMVRRGNRKFAQGGFALQQ